MFIKPPIHTYFIITNKISLPCLSNQPTKTMKISYLIVLGLGLIMASCMAPVQKQYFTESSDIDLGKKVVEAYLAGDWEAYPELYSDTARIWINENWTTKEGFTVQQYVEDMKNGLETVSSYNFDPQVWESVINADGEHWVHFWGVWQGHSEATNKDYETVVHATMLVVDNKIVLQGDIFNDTEITLDMMALAQEADEEEHDDDDDDDQ